MGLVALTSRSAQQLWEGGEVVALYVGQPSLAASHALGTVPKYAATPYPPLKFNHTGNKCPRNTHNEEIKISSG